MQRETKERQQEREWQAVFGFPFPTPTSFVLLLSRYKISFWMSLQILWCPSGIPPGLFCSLVPYWYCLHIVYILSTKKCMKSVSSSIWVEDLLCLTFFLSWQQLRLITILERPPRGLFSLVLESDSEPGGVLSVNRAAVTETFQLGLWHSRMFQTLALTHPPTTLVNEWTLKNMEHLWCVSLWICVYEVDVRVTDKRGPTDIQYAHHHAPNWCPLQLVMYVYRDVLVSVL